MQTPCLPHSTISNNDTYHVFSLGHKSGQVEEKHTFYCLHHRGTSEGKVDVSVGVEVTLSEV